MSMLEKLYDRVDFYKNAYEDFSKEKKVIEKDSLKVEKTIRTESSNILEEIIPSFLGDIEKQEIENTFKINLDDIDQEFVKREKRLNTKISELREDDRYKEYLKLLMNDDLEIVNKLEEDEVFNYFIDQNFHNDEFRNEPIIQILKFKYQPRFWKFAKIAEKKAKEFSIETYEEMFKLWFDLRSAYQSLIGDKKVREVVKECEIIDNDIKSMENEIKNIPNLYRSDVISRLIEIIISNQSFSDGRFSNIFPFRTTLLENKTKIDELNNRLTMVMENISNVEKMIDLAESDNLNVDEKSLDKFFANTDPTVSIATFIPDLEWQGIHKAFEAKGISLKSKENYTVVKTKLTKEQADAKLKEYGVKEGEIFFDKNLIGKKLR